MIRLETDTAIVGSGVAGVLVARGLARAGRETLVVERGGLVPWAEQLRRGEWEADVPGAAHDTEVDGQEGVDWDFSYVYGVGGSTNHWGGTTPRLLPEDFEMRSRFGVSRDWPLSYDDLAPWYREAEDVMAIAGAANDLMPGARYPLDPHPLSPMDRAVAPHLRPFIPCPQARPTRPVNGHAACCATAHCQLCPVDARWSVLNGLRDVLRDPRVTLRPRTIATRLRSDAGGRRIDRLECVTDAGEPVEIRARRYVVAANAFAGAALLLRSGLDEDGAGRYLFDHQITHVIVPTRRPVGPGRGNSLVTGAAYTWYTGAFRSRRAAALVLPFNSGEGLDYLADLVTQELAAGRGGRGLRRRAAERWSRTLTFDLTLDDLPDPASRVELSSRRDRFGIPLTRIVHAPPSDYQRRGIDHLLEDLPRRLRPLGAEKATIRFYRSAAHHLGTTRMGERDGVVDRDLRHRRRDNLFVCGGSVFPAYSPAHPTLTIAALALRLGEALGGRR